jgi:Carbamoyl-phosphate synthase small chain, CPSase domain
MTERLQTFTTPPTSPRTSYASPISPSSPRLFNTFPPASTPAHPRLTTRHPYRVLEYPLPPATFDLDTAVGKGTTKKVLLELADGSSFTGFSFGAEKSVGGELVFQTGTSP